MSFRIYSFLRQSRSKPKKMAAVRGEMLDLVLENLDLDEDFEIYSNILIDEEKPGLIL